MNEDMLIDYLEECFNNDIPISFTTIINSFRNLGFKIRFRDFRDSGRVMTNYRTDARMRNIQCIMLLYNDKTKYNLWVGFVDYNNVIICQLYALEADARSINRTGKNLTTHYNFIERNIIDEKKEYAKS